MAGLRINREHDQNVAHPDADFDGGFLTSRFPGSLGSGGTGFIGGGQAGYNWQTGAFVIGVETDFDGSTVGRDFHFSSTPFGGPGLFGGDVLNVNAKADLSWLGTTRARLGWVATPDNRLMIYATGGVAYGGGSAHFNVFELHHRPLLSGQPEFYAGGLDHRRRR